MEIVAAVGDARLYASDLELLGGPHWLNDQCILFWQQHLEHVQSPHVAANAVWLQPAAAFSLQFLDAEELLVDTPDNIFRTLHSKRLILVPLVSDADAMGGGGSHWTLLVYDTTQPTTMFVLDSSRSSVSSSAMHQTVRTLTQVIGLCKSMPTLEWIQCAVQKNGYDCGVHVCANAEAILQHVARCGETGTPLALQDTPLPHSVEGKRREMMEVAKHYPYHNEQK